jgi:hypothetical protein
MKVPTSTFTDPAFVFPTLEVRLARHAEKIHLQRAAKAIANATGKTTTVSGPNFTFVSEPQNG